ncbi:hypothetical protein BRD12_06910 [Halobacteriales archaeon SW_12_67_38]|nr:MAG: hypothetical protein BRC80_12045 [Halobacteriales archaeon QH_9_66_26]PSQ47990.1 MAG: hypothetical protein BRD12_06910 [Halobacteriales archaeon SW_12_67_38]
MPVVKTPDVLGGEPRLDGHRVSVLQVADPVLGDHSPAAVADQLDVTLAEVHEALAYYYNHPDEMETVRGEYEELEDDLRERSNAPRTLSQ